VFCAFHVCRGAREYQSIALRMNVHTQALFECGEILIELSEEADAILEIA